MTNRHFKKVPEITNDERNSNQNNAEIPSHASENSSIQNFQKQPLQVMMRKESSLITFGRTVVLFNLYGMQYLLISEV